METRTVHDASLELAGRTALVTGAAKRLGRAIALELARGGADVVVHYHTSGDQAEATAGDIRVLGRAAWTVPADLADAGEAGELLGRAVEAAGRPVDLLVNSASIYPSSTLLEFTNEQFAQNVQINAMAPLALVRALAAQPLERGDVVNLLDVRILDYDREHVAYHLSKRMLAALTRMLAEELAPRVAVNAVAPGLVLPPPGGDESYLERFKDTNPMQSHGDAEEIGRAVRFLVGSRFITGQTIYVDGGRHMRGRFYE